MWRFGLILAFTAFALASARADASRALAGRTASISGRVVTTGPQPVNAWWLILIPADEPQPLVGTTGALATDTDGRFQAVELDAGDYLLGFPLDPEGHTQLVTPMPEVIEVRFGETITRLPAMRLTLVEGEQRAGVEIVISITPPRRSGPHPPPPPHIHLQFLEDVNANGTVDASDPVPQTVQMLLLPWAQLPFAIELHSDTTGSATFLNVPPGDYTLHIYWPAGFALPPSDDEVPHLLRAIMRINDDGSISAPDPIPEIWPGPTDEPLDVSGDNVVVGALPGVVLLRAKDPGVGTISTDSNPQAFGVGSIDVSSALAQKKITAPGTGMHISATAVGRLKLFPVVLAVLLGSTGLAFIAVGEGTRSGPKRDRTVA